jgi:hypothetical protein
MTIFPFDEPKFEEYLLSGIVDGLSSTTSTTGG